MGDQTQNKRGTDGEGRERKHRSECVSEHGADPAELCCWTVLPAAATQSRVTGVLSCEFQDEPAFARGD